MATAKRTARKSSEAPRYRVIHSFNARIGEDNVYITRANVARVEEMTATDRQKFIESGSLEEIKSSAPAPNEG